MKRAKHPLKQRLAHFYCFLKRLVVSAQTNGLFAEIHRPFQGVSQMSALKSHEGPACARDKAAFFTSKTFM
jgi:hypothetical protein